MSADARLRVEQSLQRIGALVEALNGLADMRARETARELLEATLDLHGLAFARIAAKLAASDEGRALYAKFGDDEQIKAVLLLHGLHPKSVEERIRDAIPAIEDRLGASIQLISVLDGIAHISIDAKGCDWDQACRATGAALIDAAPDLDDIAIDPAANDAALAAE